jgi:imidazolonepropionase
MWDRLLIDCNVATMDPAVDAPFGAIQNGAVAIQDGRIVRVGRRTELAGYKRHSIEPLGGAWVTPGLIDCHTHLVSAVTGRRSSSCGCRGRAMRRSPGAGGGIASTVGRDPPGFGGRTDCFRPRAAAAR